MTKVLLKIEKRKKKKIDIKKHLATVHKLSHMINNKKRPMRMIIPKKKRKFNAKFLLPKVPAS